MEITAVVASIAGREEMVGRPGPTGRVAVVTVMVEDQIVAGKVRIGTVVARDGKILNTPWTLAVIGRKSRVKETEILISIIKALIMMAKAACYELVAIMPASKGMEELEVIQPTEDSRTSVVLHQT